MPLYDFECPGGHRFERICPMDKRGEEVPCEEASCALRAKQVFGTHSNPSSMLDHGSASNRDAAREGRYDPLKPNTRFMAKGRGWRK